VPSDPLSALEAQIVACRRCARLVAWRETTARAGWWARPVPGFGDPSARVVVVGLAPSLRGANQTGRMFSNDASARVLTRALHAVGAASQPTSLGPGDGLVLSGVWLSAACRCAPPANRPTATELAACRPFLAAELAALPWRSAVALGAVAWATLADALGYARAPFAHGARRVDPEGRLLLASYHPSPQNTNTGRLRPDMLEAVLAEAIGYAGSATT
jgi:uracil-DNA glycosylase family 4